MKTRQSPIKLTQESAIATLEKAGLHHAAHAPFWEGYVMTSNPEVMMDDYNEKHGRPPTHYRVQPSAYFLGVSDE